MADTINVGLIGYKFMGKSHSNAYRQVAAFYDVPLKPEMTVLCGHTHSPGEAQVLPNLHVLTGGAEYGRPEVQRVLTVP